MRIRSIFFGMAFLTTVACSAPAPAGPAARPDAATPVAVAPRAPGDTVPDPSRLPNAPRPVKLTLESGNGVAQLVVDDAFDRAWRRVGLALDRTGFTVVDRDRSKGLYFVRYSDPDLAARKKDDGWLAKTISQIQFWKTTDAAAKPEQYRVVVTQADPRSLVTVQDPAGAVDSSANGERILALLKDQLK